MAKHLNVNLGFTADISQAKSQLQELKNTLVNLTQISASKTSGLGLTKEINDAINAVTELQIKLQQSTTSTGSLDLGKFNQSLQQGGKKLSDYANQLQALGPEGQTAFSKLARSISLAEVPLKKSSKLLSEFATTMKNTIRWQFSSSMLHGFMGAVQSAYRYAQDLNESLNNIRIVTGASVDEMDKFADKANKAARALSATTIDYTDAALIFYQQGLDDNQVEERTNATIKMAHAAGESATKVSSYMTAVWNNFADGSKSLEYYGDVMTKLGAETAASSAEIAEGLEKFAAIGETVGLSYEYAASAVATVVDKTRQSADTVGTAFKTIFARLQGLKLGETLDDGTDLNKYSAALMSIGISIKDVQGNLKDTDVILDELGAKWKTLARDEQTALAQTVAGARQYTQLMSLMNNYDAFKKNVETAQGSTGTLNEQSRIYADSWEAARDRVTAAAEQIYAALLDDKMFIKFLNIIEKLVSGFGNLIDIMGGLKGVVPLVTTLISKSIGPDIANSIDRVLYNIKLGSKKGRQEIYNLRKESADALKAMYDDGTASGSAMYDVGSKQTDLQNTLLEKTIQLQQANKELTEEEQKQAQQLLDINASLSDQYVQLTKNKEQISEASEDLEKKALAKMGKKGEQFDISSPDGKTYKGKSGFSKAIKEAGQLQNTYKQGQKIVKAYSKEIDNLVKSNDNSSEEFENLKKRIENLNKSMDALGDVTPEVADAIKKLNEAAQAGDLEKMQKVLNRLDAASEKAGENAHDMFELIRQGAQNAGVDMKQFNPILDQIQTSFETTGALTAEQIQLFTNLGFQADEAGRIIGGFSGKVATIGDAVSATTTAVSSYAMALSQASAFGENLFDPDVGPFEKFISLIMLAGTAIQAYNDINKMSKIIEEAVAGAKARKAAASAAAAVAQKVETVATDENTDAVNENKLAWLSHPILGAISIALMAVVGIINAVSSKIKANSEEIAENAEKQREQAAASKEVFDANQDLINSYEQARQAYAEDESAKDNLINVSQELCDQLDIEGAALMRAKGDYDALTKAIYSNQKAKIDAALQDNKRAQNDTAKEFVDNMRTGADRFFGNDYIADIGTKQQLFFYDESIVSDAISNLGDEVSHITDNISQTGYIQVKTGQSTEEMIQAYEEVLSVVEEVERIAGDNTELLNNSETYQAMLDWLDKSRDSYEALIALENEEAELRTAKIINDAVANGQSISTLEEYKALRSKVIQDLQKEVELTEEEATAIADMYLKQSAAVSTLANSYTVLQDASKVSGISEDDLSEWYKTLGKDEQKLFATLNFDSARSIEELDSQLDVLQARANRTAIQTKLEVIEGAKDSLKSDMSAEDYQDYQTNSGIDWGNAEEGIMEYSKFLALSYDSQVTYLERLSERYNSELNAATDESITQNEQRIEELNGLIASADDELSKLEIALNPNNIKLEIDENGTLATNIDQITNEILKLNNLDVESNEYIELLEKLKNSGIDETTIQSYLEAHKVATGYREEIEYLNDEINELQEQDKIDSILDIKESLEKAKNLDDLQARWRQALQDAGDKGIDYSVYSEALITLAENYNNCTKEIEEYQKALKNKNQEQLKAAEDALKAAVTIGEASEKYGFDAEVLEAQAKRLGKEYKLNAEEAAKLAVKNQRMNKGVSSLVDNWKDWKKQLSATDKLTEDYAKAVADCTAAIADLVGASSDLELPDKFFNTENMALLERAVQGDINAINALGAEVAYFTVEALDFNQAFADLVIGLESFNGFDISEIDLSNVLNAKQFKADKDLVLQGITDIKNGLIAEGQSMGDDWVAALNRMAIITGMSVEQMNGLLGSLGVQAKVDTTYIRQPMEFPTYSEQIQDITYREVPRYEIDEDGEQKQVGVSKVPEYRKATIPGETITVEGYAAVAQISTEDNPLTLQVNESVAGGNAPISNNQRSGSASYTPNRGPVAPSAKKGSKKGGDNKSAKKIETTKKEDIIDRYKELNDILDDIADAYEDASKEADRLYGKARIDKIKQQNAYLQQEISLLKDKITAAKAYLAIDRQALDIAAKKAGVSFVYDEAGNLTNYTKQMETLYAELRAAQDAWNADYKNKTQEEQQKYEENILQPIQDKIDELKEAIEAYEETRELIEDLENEIDDKFYEWQDNNYEMLHYKLEVEIEINDLELEMLDYYLNKLSDDFYQLAESAQFMVDKIPTITDSLGHYENFYNEITAAYAAGEISQADYVEGMKESYSAILDNLTVLNDLDKEMLHYYEDTLAAASEELAYYTDQMEHLTNVLDHYRNIVKLVNGEYDYKSINTILTARTETIKNELDVATANYQMLLTEKAAIEASLAGAADDAAREVFENELKAITTAVNEAQEEMLSKTEQWTEEMKALMENTLAEAAHQMEMSFTNGIGFDRLNDSLDRLSAYSEIYLTKTNQIYETQKLMNTAQMAIDKTTNEAARVRLDNYIKEIEVLQDKNKLTKIELDLAQARYDVLLAEIALEEAQNAKSTVRLQRDNEGNFGYVYTADQEAVSQAEQDLLDAQNALYNIGLEGTNEYGQKLLELQQQLSDQLIALEEARVEGQFATDAEYYAARDKLIKEYDDLFAGYSEAYTVALGEDLVIQEEAWIQAYSNMIDQSLDWKDKTTQYTEECENAYESWRETVQTESAIVDSVLNDLESEVKDVTSASTLLRNEVVGNVIPAINNELVAVRNVTSAYAAQRAQIQELIAYYEQLAQAILNAIRAQASASQNTAQQQQQQNYAPVDDYSREMAEHLAGGGSTTDEYYQWLLAERNKKLQQEEYAKYQSTANQLYDTLEQYGKDQAVTDYVDMLVKDNKKYFYDANGNIIAITSMASGGYTGAWGPEGRLAVLHEKELVLNAQDTENILTAANVIRQLADIIDLEALHSSQGFGMSFSQASLSSSAGQLEQMVTIEAHFPAVQDRNEIEEAFNNLINTASQYANRK